MGRVQVPQSGGVVTVFAGGEAHEYRVESVDEGAAGVIEVPSSHLPSVLSSVPGSQWLDPPVDEGDSAGKTKPEAPAKTAASRRAGEPKPEAPAKEK